MSEVVVVTLITVVGGGLLGILGTLVAKVNHVGRRVKEVGVDATIAREQTQNSHDTNLRDNIDKNHKETVDMFKLLHADVLGLKSSDRDQWTAIEKLRARQ